jgi:hypothetical protein
MEFWIGLSVGMHLGKIIADCLEKFGLAYGLLGEETVKDLDSYQEAATQIGNIAGGVAED